MSVYHIRKKGLSVIWMEFIRIPKMGLFIQVRPICDSGILVMPLVGLAEAAH
jgi:hypothetical protein